MQFELSKNLNENGYNKWGNLFCLLQGHHLFPMVRLVYLYQELFDSHNSSDANMSGFLTTILLNWKQGKFPYLS